MGGTQFLNFPKIEYSGRKFCLLRFIKKKNTRRTVFSTGVYNKIYSGCKDTHPQLKLFLGCGFDTTGFDNHTPCSFLQCGPDTAGYMSQGRGEIEVRNFSQFSAILQFSAIFRNFPQFSAIFRNFSAIFLTSRFSDCLPTLVQNSEKKKFFYYAIHSVMFPSHQILT